MPQGFKQKCDYWWRGSVRPPLGLARLPKKLGYRRVKFDEITVEIMQYESMLL